MVASETLDDIDNTLHVDVYRTIVLGHYIQYWGLPTYRRVVRQGADRPSFEVYAFPSTGTGRPFRIATVGLAEKIKADGEREGKEYYMALQDDFGGATLEEVFDYLVATVTLIVAEEDRSSLPRVLKPSVPVLAKWAATALLIDEANAERDGFETVCIACQFDVQIAWLVPLRDAEYQLILEQGVEKFDELVQASEQSLIDPNREGLVG